MTPEIKPTPIQFTAYQAMFDHFNAALFESGLSPVLLNFSRKAKSYGFFAPERWTSGEHVRHEISLNPEHLATRPLIETASTLVHEMVHAWQQEHGRKCPRTGYHNKEWAGRMKEAGLHPSNTGEPGGRETGQRMTHYIVAGGAFADAFAVLPEAARLPWSSVIEVAPEKKKVRNKIKYTCEGCGANVWGKPGIEATCSGCDQAFEPEEDPEDPEPD